MANPETTSQRRHGALTTLLAVGTLAPVTLNGLSSALHGNVPPWVGAAVSVTALSGALVLMWRQRQLRGAFLVALAGAALVAAVAGWWTSVAT